MAMTKNILLGILVAHLLLGCKGQPEKRKDSLAVESTQTSIESPSSGIEDDFEIIEYSIAGDTLRIVSTSNFLYYPFGCYVGAEEFLERYLFMKKSEEQGSFIGDTPVSKIALYRFSFNNSYVKFLHDGEKNRMELVGARITDEEVLLDNRVKIGITKADFINRFTNEIGSEQIKNVTVIEFISGALGVWHYYFFENDTLTSFYIDTDYQLDKD